jgi:DNA-binding response OmpR family regulator
LLVIEDSATQLFVIKKTLEAEGYSVFEATNAAEGLAKAYVLAPDLIISDVVMTGINGYQLCRLVKNDSDLSGVPVILLTKLDSSLDRFWGLKSGADRYIPKEPGFPSLIRAVRELLSESEAQPLRVLGDPSRNPTPEEINSRLNQLLDQLLFEATIIDEVRRIGEDLLDLDVMSAKLFGLLGSILSYSGAALLVNHGSYSSILIDKTSDLSGDALIAYAAPLANQLGLPPLDESPALLDSVEIQNALTQTIDAAGSRLGLLIVVPQPGSAYKPIDQKVIKLICEQLCVVLRLYQFNNQNQLSRRSRLTAPAQND